MTDGREAVRGALTHTAVGLRVETPPEDWLCKVVRDDAVVDVLHRIGGVPVEPELLERAVETEVLWIRSATDPVAGKLLALSEHACDFGTVLPAARALREQVDGERARGEVADSPDAEAFLVLVQRLGIAPG